MGTICMRSDTTNAAAGDADKLPPYVQYQTRRGYRLWFKVQLVRESFAPGASVSIVARRHNIKRNVLFSWRKQYHEGLLRTLEPDTRDGFVPMAMIGKGAVRSAGRGRRGRFSASRGRSGAAIANGEECRGADRAPGAASAPPGATATATAPSTPASGRCNCASQSYGKGVVIRFQSMRLRQHVASQLAGTVCQAVLHCVT